ncbi:unnamed protein product [Coregonus sp. 'balchen']|nr:unnamed protein product [Coregonus sp. 'balchen']
MPKLRGISMQVSRPVCVDVPSETEAVVGNPMKLTCISCMKREEVSAETRVDWGRLVWNGSKDLQELSISILNVTMNDTGTYKCVVFRQFEFDCYSPSVTNSLVINLVMVYCYRKISKSDEQAQDTAY